MECIDFEVEVTGCDSSAITSVAVSPQTFTHSAVTADTETFDFTDWIESMGVCGPFTYLATLDDGTALPALLTFNDATKTFTIDKN